MENIPGMKNVPICGCGEELQLVRVTDGSYLRESDETFLQEAKDSKGNTYSYKLKLMEVVEGENGDGAFSPEAKDSQGDAWHYFECAKCIEKYEDELI